MGPPEFTGGNASSAVSGSPTSCGCFNGAAGIHRRKLLALRNLNRISSRFNGAAGIHRRKPALRGWMLVLMLPRFNGAAGIHRRKLAVAMGVYADLFDASMGPPEFTGGNSTSWSQMHSAVVSLQWGRRNSPAETCAQVEEGA